MKRILDCDTAESFKKNKITEPESIDWVHTLLKAGTVSVEIDNVNKKYSIINYCIEKDDYESIRVLRHGWGNFKHELSINSVVFMKKIVECRSSSCFEYFKSLGYRFLPDEYYGTSRVFGYAYVR